MMRLFVICIGLLLAFPAHAVDFNKAFVDDDGVTIWTCVEYERMANPPKCLRSSELTLLRAARNGLGTKFQDEPNLSGDESYKRGDLAQELSKPDIKLKAEDIALIKKLIAKLYPPTVVFQAWRELDPSLQDKDKK
jgi:hypothetical protein